MSKQAITVSGNEQEAGLDACGCMRRSLLTGAIALALSPLSGLAAQDAAGGRNARPQAGDRLAFTDGDRAGQQVMVDDIQVGDAPKFAYPVDPTSQTVRDGSRLNQVLLVRLDDKDISERTRPHGADGVVAYSAICTHYGCPVTTLHENKHAVTCNCHGSTFDAGNNGEITVGPATRRLAILPLKAVDGALVVAAPFIGRLGPPQE